MGKCFYGARNIKRSKMEKHGGNIMNTKHKAGRLLFFAGVFTAFLFSFFSSFTHSEETEEAVAMLTEMSGSVLVKDAQDGSFKKAEINQPLYAGDEIRTKKGAS